MDDATEKSSLIKDSLEVGQDRRPKYYDSKNIAIECISC